MIAKDPQPGRKIDVEAKLAGWAAILGLAFAASAQAGIVDMPNGDFSATGNAGSVGGGLLTPSASNVPIGPDGGPWKGNYAGALGVLAPPSLTIDAAAGTATISGIAGLSVGGIISNGGSFSQALPLAYEANKRYTVWTDVDVGETLALALLADTNVGVAFTSGGSVLASSATAATGLVDLSLLNGDTYRLTFVHDTGASVNGNVGIALFDQPAGLLTASLIGGVSFGHVGLNVGAITDATTQMHVSGFGSLSAEVNTPFEGTLKALVTDANGNPLEGVIINADAPGSGASAVLSSQLDTGISVRAVTGSDGIAEIGATANAIAGCYKVTASLPGSTAKAVFNLRNWSVEDMAAFSARGIVPYLLQDSIFCDGYE